jgi:hypothetical protein
MSNCQRSRPPRRMAFAMSFRGKDAVIESAAEKQTG